MSPSTASNNRFFGLDLSSLGSELAKGWQVLRNSPALAWLTPTLPVRLLQADGTESFWQVDEATPRKQPGGVKQAAARFMALELPENLLLRRTLSMPAMPAIAVAEAAALEVRSSSPFGPDDTAWGFTSHRVTAHQGLRVDTALASRKQIASYLESQQARLPPASTPEIWALIPGERPIVLAGFGETRRQAALVRQLRFSYALVALALLLLLAIAITPTLQLRQRAMQAVSAYDALLLRTKPLLRQRDALNQSSSSLAALHDTLIERADPLRVMDTLTQALPDDTSLFTLQIQGLKVSMTGQTTNAAALMQTLSAHPALRDVRAPSAATRPPGANKESFSIELSIDPKVLGIPTGTSAGATAASVAAAPAGASSSPPVAQGNSPAPSSDGGFSVGGGAASSATAKPPAPVPAHPAAPVANPSAGGGLPPSA
ncbi:MAG TPA: PilN domain-containing protein, partial [Burkholderiaceae bacterium]